MDKTQLEEGLEELIQFYKYKDGLAPVIVQEYNSGKPGEILMLAYADRKAFDITREIGYATFYSRSKKKYWTKGEESGNRLIIKEIRVDCDQDAILYLIEKEKGGACHTEITEGENKGEARNSCFYRRIKDDGNLEFLKGMK
jgi:phosphoribosyl-AMP cyclohydrolase